METRRHQGPLSLPRRDTRHVLRHDTRPGLQASPQQRAAGRREHPSEEAATTRRGVGGTGETPGVTGVVLLVPKFNITRVMLDTSGPLTRLYRIRCEELGFLACLRNHFIPPFALLPTLDPLHIHWAPVHAPGSDWYLEVPRRQVLAIRMDVLREIGRGPAVQDSLLEAETSLPKATVTKWPEKYRWEGLPDAVVEGGEQGALGSLSRPEAGGGALG